MKCTKCKAKLLEEVTCVETGTYDIYCCESCGSRFRRDYFPSELYEVLKYSEADEKRKSFKEKYDFICCNCGCEQWAKPSMSMTVLGRNSGCGSCSECKKFLHLEIDGGLEGDEMISTLWEDYTKPSRKTEEKK